MQKFRSERKRLPLHPLEKAVVAAVAIHLCFLPWALGSTRAWAQIISLCLATVGFAIALLPRDYNSAQSGGTPFRLSPWPRLLKFPLFWVGLALLVYIVIQGLNPSWAFEQNEKVWWLRRIESISWLPTSVEAPFERFNAWRELIIYASGWLLVCTLWIGITRKRPLQLLLIILVSNACVLALAGFAQNMLFHRIILGLIRAPDNTTPFATFIYHNHAGAYFSLLIACTVTMSVIMADQRIAKMRKSSPSSLFIAAAILLSGALLVILSRGAILLAGAFFVSFGLWLWLRGRLKPQAGLNSTVNLLVIGLFLGIAIFTARSLDFSNIGVKFTKLYRQQGKEESAQGRILAHKSAQQMLSDHWGRGVGSGAFSYLFPAYINKYPEAYQDGKLFWRHAHSDWLEIPIELGLVGCAILLLGAGVVVIFFIKQRAKWSSPVFVLLIGSGQTLAHAWFDFPFQSPAVLYTWLALIIIAMRWLELETSAETTRDPAVG
ncbi:O-antigen ligase family protein [Oleiharenicola lentus]|uniref:O-antigen ligase family protein n=1 Tax=Oleiharenicola lentus TaxID=2508720 RepID=UPI003F66E020